MKVGGCFANKGGTEIIEYCDVSVLFERETFYIQTLKPEYNILQSGGSNIGYKHTEETKAKLSESASNRSDELKAKYSKAALGRKFHHTEETKAKLSAASLNRRLSEETRAKLSVIQSNRLKHPVPPPAYQPQSSVSPQRSSLSHIFTYGAIFGLLRIFFFFY